MPRSVSSTVWIWVGRQDLDLARLHPRCIDHARDIAGDGAPLGGVLEHGVRHPVQVEPGAIGEPVLGHGGVDRLQVGGAQLLQRQVADAGGEMVAQELRVAGPRLVADVVVGPVPQPALGELATVSPLASTYWPVAMPAMILAASACACRFVPRTVTYLVSRSPPVVPTSNLMRQHDLPRRVMLPLTLPSFWRCW